MSRSAVFSATAGNILDLKYNFHLGAGDNGNVFQIVNNRDTNRPVPQVCAPVLGSNLGDTLPQFQRCWALTWETRCLSSSAV